jgi:hypothetical protein
MQMWVSLVGRYPQGILPEGECGDICPHISHGMMYSCIPFVAQNTRPLYSGSSAINSACKHFCIRMVAEPSVDELRGFVSYPPPCTNRPQLWQLQPPILQSVWLSPQAEDRRVWGQASRLA